MEGGRMASARGQRWGQGRSRRWKDNRARAAFAVGACTAIAITRRPCAAGVAAHTCTRLKTCAEQHVHACVHACTARCVNACMRVCMHAQRGVYMYACACACMHNAECTCVHACVHACTARCVHACAPRPCMQAGTWGMRACLHTFILRNCRRVV
eukprot:355093-Chlamydomonas_euryale.AAC.5